MMIDQPEIHRNVRSLEVKDRKWAVKVLGMKFADLRDKKQAWNDLHRLTRDTDNYVQRRAVDSLGSAFPHVPDKAQAWNVLHRLTEDTDSYVRQGAAKALGSAFPHVPDKAQAWNVLHRLTEDTDSYVQWGAADSLGSAFPHIPDKEQAWDDLHRLAGYRRAGDPDVAAIVREGAAKSLGSAFPYVPDKEQAGDDLHRLAGDRDVGVSVSANHSLGRVSIFKATEAESEDEFRTEIKNALGFFEKSSEVNFLTPAKFCNLFYRSFYTILFKKPEAETEVQNYLTEAKRATEGSKSREKLLEIIEHLADALREVQEAKKKDLDGIKDHLKFCKQHCDQALTLLETTEEKAPGAAKLIRRGLPIIDQKIKELLSEIKEKSKDICRNAAVLEAELGCKIEKHATDAIATDNPNETHRSINNILDDFDTWSHSILDDNERKYIQRIINDSRNEDVNGKVSNIRTLVARVLEFPKDKRYEKSNFERDDFPYKIEFESEISDLFKSVYQKEREKGESDVNSKTLAFLKTKLHDLNAAKSPFTWLDVGCGYGRALDVIDAVTLPRDMFEYHGIDAMHKYLDDMEKQAKKHKLVHWQIEKMDAAQMHFNLEFDIISAVLLLHEIDPLCLPYVVKNMVRALKPEGTLVISDFQGPYEQEEGIVAWSAEDIKQVLESICGEAKASFEPIPAGKYPKELGFYACYVKKSDIDNAKFERFMENYKEFLEQKKTESKELRNELRRQIKERVTDILGRSDIDTKNISPEDMEKIKGAIKPEYGIKAHKIRLLSTQIEFLDDKIAEFNSGTRCAGAD